MKTWRRKPAWNSLTWPGGSADVKLRYADLQAQPRRYNTSPLWSGLMNDGRAYAPYTYNYDKLVPWRTLTGRQHFYLDHEMYIAYGENLPTYKPAPKPELYGDLKETLKDGEALVLNYLTPHGKWHIHSTYMENLRMLTLSRGCEPCWMSEVDADKLGIKDNDWVEVYNDHGVYCTRAVVSARIPRGVCIVYHVPERTTGIPKSQVRGNRRAGGHNSVTRIHLKPNYLSGGYGQFSYHFNYWGPIAPNRDTHVTDQENGQGRSGNHTTEKKYGYSLTNLNGIPPGQMYRLPHLFDCMQEHLDRPQRRRVPVVEQC